MAYILNALCILSLCVKKKYSFYHSFITEFSYAGTSKTIINPRKLAVTNLYNSTVCGLYKYLYLFEGGGENAKNYVTIEHLNDEHTKSRRVTLRVFSTCNVVMNNEKLSNRNIGSF